MAAAQPTGASVHPDHHRGDSDPNADEALRRVRQSDARPLPTETRARRRVLAQRGW